jgi:ABC-type antimicrobial peptide transport system permease subunit
VIQVSTGSGTSAERQARLAELAARIAALPEVESFATVLGPASFLTRGWMPLPSALDGRDPVGYVRASLYAFTPYDWRLWSIAGMIILVSGLMGTLIPAVRASRVDPATVLKAE